MNPTISPYPSPYPTLSDSAKKALLVFGVAFAVFILFRPKMKKQNTLKQGGASVPEPKERKKIAMPTLNAKDVKNNTKAKNAFIVMKAYVAAYNNNEPQSALDELNKEFSKEYALRVYHKPDGRIAVCDLGGRDIIVNNA